MCHDCVNNMHTGSRTMPDGTRADVFRCNSDRHGKGTPKPTVTKATTLAWVHAEFVERFGFMRRTQIVRTAGVDHRPEIAELEENLHELNGRFPRMRGAAADLVESQMNGISDRLASLQALPIEPPRIQVVELDTTWGDAFIDATDEGKRQIMLDMGVRVTVGPPTGWRRPVEERLVMTIERDDPVRDELDDVAAQELL